jgi:fatty acid desaturase
MQEIIEKPIEIPAPIFTPSEEQKKPRTISFYREALTPHLDPDILKADPWRLIWYGAFTLGSLVAFLFIVNGGFSWPIKLCLGLLLGYCNGTLGFICHEILHGSVIKNQKLQSVMVFFGAIPFFISPTFWRFWHNRLHHGKTQQLIFDPDAFPNLKIYKHSKFMQFMYPFTPGSGHKRSYSYFFFWFSFHIFVAESYLRFRNKIYGPLNHRQVNIEFGLQLLMALGLFIYAGSANLLWVFLIPLAVQNYVLMSYIATNHNLNPLTSENDPLVNSLTVTNHPVLEFLHLNFGYHVEHHIFPTARGSKMKDIHRELVRQFPETYLIMPKWKAMKNLYATARIYKNANVLINPETGQTFETLTSNNLEV